MVIFILVVSFFLALSYFNRRIKLKNNYVPTQAESLSNDEIEFIRLINEHRINAGLNPLIAEKLACEVCEKRLLNDITNNYNASHYDWEKLITESNAKEGSHLVANNFATPLTMFNAYIDSEQHKEAIDGVNRTHIGTSFINRMNHTIIVKY